MVTKSWREMGIDAGVMQDVVERFALSPVSLFGEVPGTKASAAGAYYPETKAVHISSWALQPAIWSDFSKLQANYNFVSDLPLGTLLGITESASDAAEAVHFGFVAIPSVRGTVTHGV